MNESARFGHEKNIIPRELRTERFRFQTPSVRMSARENKQEIRIASCFYLLTLVIGHVLNLLNHSLLKTEDFSIEV